MFFVPKDIGYEGRFSGSTLSYENADLIVTDLTGIKFSELYLAHPELRI